MTVSLWMLLGFAAWTLLTLLAGVGARRWMLILSGRAALTSFPGDTPHGSAAYRRAMRAHANCVENLPVFGALVLIATAAGLHSPGIDGLAMAVLAGRIGQTSVHVALPERSGTIALRFAFFLLQIVAMISMGVLISTMAVAR